MARMAAPATLLDSELFLDVLATVLGQLGCAVLPPSRPAAVAQVLRGAGRLDHEECFYDAPDLEPWQPCLLHLSLAHRAEDFGKGTGKQGDTYQDGDLSNDDVRRSVAAGA